MRSVTSRVLLATLLAMFLAGVAIPAIAAIDAPGVTGEVTFDGGPVVGADIQVLSSGVVVGTATTTPTGAYEVALAAPGSFDVRVTPPAALGVMAQTVRGVAVADASSIAVVDVALRRPLGSVRVQTVDGTGAALAGLRVRLVGTAPAPLSVVDLAVTDAAGNVELRAPVGVDYQLRVDAITGSAVAVPADFTLRVVETVQSTAAGTDVLLTLPTATLDVTTNRTGSGVVGNVVVAASGSPTGLVLGGGFTGNGSFESVGTTSTGGLVSLPVVKGPVTVEAFPRDRLLLGTSTNLTVAASSTSVSLELGIALTETVSITLRDGVGIVVPGASVKATTSAITDDDGAASVVVRTDQPTGVTVTALGDGLLDLPDRLTFTRATNAGATDTLQPILADLTVDVIDDVTSAPVTGALVSVSSPSVAAGAWAVRSIENARTTDGSGRVVFRLVPGASYDITVTVGSTRIASESIALDAGGSTSVVRLPAAPPTSGTGFVTISGRVVTPALDGIAGLVVRSTLGGSASTTNANGDFAVRVSAVATHSLTISGTRLLRANGFDAEVPDRLEVRVPNVATITGTPTGVAVDVGSVVLPIDRLDVRVTDETGGGLFSLVARTPLSGGRSTARVNGAPVTVSASSGYVDDGLRLDRFGEGTMFLFGGTHQVTVGEESLTNFGDIDLPVTESASLTSGDDTLLLVLTRRYGTPVTSLTGSPLVSSTSTTLTLQLPDALLTPLVQLTEPMLGSPTTQVILTNRWFCGDSNTMIVTDPAACAEPVRDIELIENGIPAALKFGTYPIAARSFVSGPPFIQEGFRRSTLVLAPPIDEPPMLTATAAVTPAPEGSLTLLSATATDAEGPVVVAWDLDGDGVGDAEGDSVWVDVPDGPSFTSFATIVTDSAGRSTRGNVEVESVNVAPTGMLRVTGPDPSGLVTVRVTDLDDAATADVATLTVEIDLDDDATFETAAASATINASAFADGTYPIAARVLDKDGGATTLTGSFLVAAPTSTTAAPTTAAPTTAGPTTAAPTTAAPTMPNVPPATAPATPPAPTPVDPLGTQLPETGGDAVRLTISALGILALGIGLVAATRRRGSVPPQGLEP